MQSYPTAWIFLILELLVYMMQATSDGANYFPGTTQARLFAGHANLVKKCVCVCFFFGVGGHFRSTRSGRLKATDHI